MAVGAGLSASFGIATETTVGTPVAVTRFYEFDSETLSMKKHTAQGVGLRQGALTKRGARRILTGREAGGDVSLDVVTNGFGLLLQHMLGSFTATATSVGGGLYQQVHNIGTLNGKSFTAQVVDPDTSGVLTQEAFTYPGCKITAWDLSVAAGAQAKLKLTIDALDEATPSNGFASTTLSALAAVGATSISTVASIPAGSYVTLDSYANSEVVQTSAVSGSGPYVSTLVAPTKVAHASGVYAGSATAVNYGAATALQTASYNSTSNLFSFVYGGIYTGGTTATTGGLFTNTGGTKVGSVRNFTLSGKNSVKADRWQLGYTTRSEQIENNYRDYSAQMEIDYTGRAFYDAYAAEAPLSVQLQFTTPTGAALSFYMPYGQQNDGASPEVAGADVISQKLAFEFLDDGTNGAIQAVYTSTDSTV